MLTGVSHEVRNRHA